MTEIELNDYFPKLKNSAGKTQANLIVARLTAPSDVQLTDQQLQIHNAFINYRNTATLVALMQEQDIPMDQGMFALHEKSLNILQQTISADELQILTIAIVRVVEI